MARPAEGRQAGPAVVKEAGRLSGPGGARGGRAREGRGRHGWILAGGEGEGGAADELGFRRSSTAAALKHQFSLKEFH